LELTIELSADLERRLAEEAARRGQPAAQFARAILEERLVPPEGPDEIAERTPEQILDAYFAQYPHASPEALAALAREQGIDPASTVERPSGEPPVNEEEFNVDAFLAARKQWQSEGRPLGVGLTDPEDSRQ
jgi:hypothetical protein